MEVSLSPILVTGAHRSGTTWVGKMLAANRHIAYISEPLNVFHRPGVFSAPVSHWYTYITWENEELYLPAFQKMLAYQYGVLAEMRSLRSGKDFLRMLRDLSTFLVARLEHRRALIKDPFAVFSIPWFIQRLGAQVVVTVRHPAGFASSLKRLNWKFNLRKNLLAQPLLVRDHLGAYLDGIRSSPMQDLIEQAAWLWKIIYQEVHKMKQQYPQIYLVRQEDLATSPLENFRCLYRNLALEYTLNVEKAILASSNSENPVELRSTHSIRLNSRASLQNWKQRLSTEEIERIKCITADVWPLYYAAEEW